MQVNAVMTTTDGKGKKQTTTITYLRESQKSQATALAESLNALTIDTLVSVKVNELDVTNKSTPTLTISSFEPDPQVGSLVRATITYNGDGQLLMNCTNQAILDRANNLLKVVISPSTSFTGTLYATETNNYAAAILNFSRG